MQRFGLPYHGLHQGIHADFVGSEQHTLGFQLGNGEWVYTDAFAGTNSRYMKHPSRSYTITPTQTDIDNGWTWKDYLLICGRTPTIGGTSLGDGAWLYVDGNGEVWLMRVVAVPDLTVANKITLNFYVESHLGMFFCTETNPYTPRNKLIYQHEMFIRTGAFGGEQDDYNLTVDNTKTFENGVSPQMQWNSTGSDCILAVTHPEETGSGANQLFYYFDTSYGFTLIQDYPASSSGWLTNIIRWEVDGDGLLSSDLAELGDGISINITRNDEYTHYADTDPEYEGPAGFEAGGKTWWLYTDSGPGTIYNDEYGMIGDFFYDMNDNLIEVRMKIEVQRGSTDPVFKEYFYDCSIVHWDGTTETVVGTYSRTARSDTSPNYPELEQYRPVMSFDRCGAADVSGIVFEDPWHPVLEGLPPGNQKENGIEMAEYWVALRDAPVEINGSPGTDQWIRVSDDNYYAGNLFPWPSYYDHCAWQPVDKSFWWTKQYTGGVQQGWDPVPCYV